MAARLGFCAGRGERDEGGDRHEKIRRKMKEEGSGEGIEEGGGARLSAAVGLAGRRREEGGGDGIPGKSSASPRSLGRSGGCWL